jgi:hypothetical protein
MPPTTVKKIEEFVHELEPNRARHCPANPSLFAVRVDDAPITIFKRGNKFP